MLVLARQDVEVHLGGEAARESGWSDPTAERDQILCVQDSGRALLVQPAFKWHLAGMHQLAAFVTSWLRERQQFLGVRVFPGKQDAGLLK